MRGLINIFLTVSFVGSAAAQTIDDWLVVDAVAAVHRRENSKLEEIEGKQQKLILATTAMSTSSVLLVTTEQKLHRGLERVYDVIDNAELILQIVKTSREIMDIQDKILEISIDQPELAVVSAAYEVHFLKKASAAMLRLLAATKESRFNLMDNKQRLDLLGNTADTLQEIRLECIKLYRIIESIRLTLDLGLLAELEPLEIDFSAAIDEMEQEIENLIQE